MSRRVERMFSSIAPDYDRTNRVLSLGIDVRWRRKAVGAALVDAPRRILDVACGTGDLALWLAKAAPHARVTGVDFSRPMLEKALVKGRAARLGVSWAHGDALRLPFSGGVFDAATIAFGIRNLDDAAAGLAEMRRVVRPGGRIVVLEFGQPSGLLAAPYRFYSKAIMPRLGGWLTGNRSAYEYLPRTAAAFPAGEAFLRLMRDAGGFAQTRARSLTGGIAWIYEGVVAPA